MSRALSILLVPLLLLGAAGARAATPLDAKAARAAAERFLRSSTKLAVPKKGRLVPGAIAQVRANDGMPVTGTGGFALEYDVHHKGEPSRRVHLFVDHNGDAHELHQQELNLAHKVPRRFHLPSFLSGTSLVQIGLTASLGLLQIPNLFGSGSNGATTALTGAALALLIGNTTKVIFDAHKSRSDGKTQSMVQTVQYIKDRVDSKTRTVAYPSLPQTYRFYRQKLAELAPGVDAMPLAEFSERVWAYGF